MDKPIRDELLVGGQYIAYYGSDRMMQVSSRQAVGIVTAPSPLIPRWRYVIWRCRIHPPSEGRNAGRWWHVTAQRDLSPEEITYFEERVAALQLAGQV